MAKERYSDTGEMAAFGFIANALESGRGGDGDTGRSFPRTDAEDMSKGARFIPGEVTLARRAGKKVNFVTECGPNCWYWKMSDGTRIYHYDPMACRQIGTANGRKPVEGKYGGTHFEDGPGPCPHCGNINTNGGTIKP
ncbi:MAG: hypothetical protein AAB597_02515 [Patescibacteria group bacterium]